MFVAIKQAVKMEQLLAGHNDARPDAFLGDAGCK